MERVLQYTLLRGEHQIKNLTAEAQTLHQEAQRLREENVALKKLQRLQDRELNDMSKIVQMVNNTARVTRKDARDTEASCVDVSLSVRKKNMDILHLNDEVKRYEKLLAMDRKLPRRSILEERLGRAEAELEHKDRELENLHKQVVVADKKAAREIRKENKKYQKLQVEVQGTVNECDELKSRIKDAEHKLSKTNIYSKRHAAKALPAPQPLAAITWKEQEPNNKVERWLNNNQDKQKAKR
ncbi:predicted protein [Nematostella vectensis]|uniref:Lebercilin domain-containing protein n=2 Tax=Nematostella vectensis TaxID=45351 RepID=A7RVX7_NEMVE|nr:predicted protein [Nematostella vectensis]|eukprot:XP_001636378.1 predicted protein [Nematostella vectensis]